MIQEGRILHSPIRDQVAGIGVGIVGGEVLSDLDYAEDSAAEVDMNIFMTGSGRFAGIHGTAEAATFDEPQLQALLAIAREGLGELFAQQRKALGLKPTGPFDHHARGAMHK
jgi:ribonuclease PH